MSQKRDWVAIGLGTTALTGCVAILSVFGTAVAQTIQARQAKKQAPATYQVAHAEQPIYQLAQKNKQKEKSE